MRDLAVKQAVQLSDWRFKAEPADSDTDWSTPEFAGDRAAWPAVGVPGVWDKSPGNVSLPVPEQAGWFRTRIPLPEHTDNEEFALCFLGVKYIADIFVNGEYLGVHRGGYTPFLFTLPEEALKKDQLEILVRVDNRLDNLSIPKKHTGWEVYGGIDREVYLLVRPKTRPENIFVQTYQNETDKWTLRLQAETIGHPDKPLEIELSLVGKPVLQEQVKDWSDGVDLTFPLENSALWSPENPVLHQLKLTWGKNQVSFPIGIRELKWVDGKLQVNGFPVWLQGFGQHEFYPEAGSVLTSEQRRKDLEMMKNLYGANALRTGHYPHHPNLFHLADEIGLLLFTEIPVWQNQADSLVQPPVWDNWIAPQLDEMILRYRNHPSIFGWGVLNEIGGAHAYIMQARERIHQLDPGRGVAAVIASDNDFTINTLTDFAARNLHYGWYHSRSVYKLREGVDQNLANANGLPLWVAELGGQARPGRLGGGYSDKIRGTETYQDKMTRFGLQYVMSRADEMAGISLWTWSDYARGGKPLYHGILSADRKPKFAAYTAMNLTAPPLAALGIEERASISQGETFKADLFVFAQDPQPGKQVRFHWQIRSAKTVIKEGTFPIKLGETRATPAGKTHWQVSENPDQPLHFLYVELKDEHGNFLHSQAVPFETSDHNRPGILRLPPHRDGREHLAEFYGMTFKIYPHTGFMLPLPPGDYQITVDNKVYEFSMEHGTFTEITWEE